MALYFQTVLSAAVDHMGLHQQMTTIWACLAFAIGRKAIFLAETAIKFGVWIAASDSRQSSQYVGAVSNNRQLASPNERLMLICGFRLVLY